MWKLNIYHNVYLYIYIYYIYICWVTVGSMVSLGAGWKLIKRKRFFKKGGKKVQNNDGTAHQKELQKGAQK